METAGAFKLLMAAPKHLRKICLVFFLFSIKKIELCLEKGSEQVKEFLLRSEGVTGSDGPMWVLLLAGCPPVPLL